MNRFLRLLFSGLAGGALLVGGLSACETTKRGFPEVSSPSTDPDAVNRRKLEASSKQVAEVAEGKIRYIVPREQLSAAFTRQFGDGTAIDKTVIRKVQETAKDKAVYYLVGMGLRNGMFRAMALPLQTSSDNSLYLSSNAARYIITGVGCTFCFFNFEKNEIVGTTCEENTGGSRCDLRVEETNGFFQRR
ncbi:hypothetical protein MUN84_02620 [Hymenobacter sp. 5516J-16]|uniref:Lipoprotein n=1 Tax=Hymenobacter sublimis TaxID=2933777 RepID=A0ABY4J700_9BACT|nr:MULTISPECIES: hypothetical protein [Hymenobacter]UOQ77602.1 hypothetical protein MUN84_02620 [Hymenobacter sp. 5516J-16]UPL47582.1 hypothetical protein MWH26_10260 [Hymenobacter sublimis]